MSEPNTEQPADAAQTAAASSPAPKPARSPVERMIVWGGIVVLLLLVAVQAHARFGYEWTLKALSDKVKEDDVGETPDPLLRSEVPNHIVGWPSRTDDEERRVTTLGWTGLGRTYEIYIAYDRGEGDEAAVMGILTKNAPPPPAPPEPGPDVPDGGPGGGGGGADAAGGGGPPQHDPEIGGSGEGAGGPPGERREFDPWQFDADGDRRISLEEAPDRMKENFERLDGNADGFIDEEEFAAMRARRGERGESERPERPERPELESSEGDSADANPEASTEESAGDVSPAP